MPRYRLAIFDLDGTILNTIGQLAHSLNVARKESGLAVLDESDIKAHVGRGVKNLVCWSLQDEKENLYETVMNSYRNYYNENCIENTYMYEGIKDLLQKLNSKGIKVAVVTNKSDSPARKLCEHFYPGLIATVRGHREDAPHKPDPFLVEEVLQELDVRREDAVYIGDSEVDILTAQNSGMDSISVSWGYKSREFLIEHEARVLADSAEELARLILK